MERRADKPAAEIRCPECGLVIKVTSQPLDKCPVCGAKLPVPPAGKKGAPERKGPISLDQALFKSPRVRESWAPREMLGVFILTYFVFYAANYLILASGLVTTTDSQLKFDIGGFFSLNLVGVLIGMTPLVYVLASKTSVRKLAIKELNAREWRWMILLGIAFGIGLFALQQLGSAINQATGLNVFVQSQANIDYDGYIDSNIGNKLFMLLPVAAAQVVGEFLYRGVILNGILQWLRKRMPPMTTTALKASAWVLSVLLGTLFDFSAFLNPASLVPSLFVHALIGALYVFTGNVQSCMIAQGTYMVLAITLI